MGSSPILHRQRILLLLSVSVRRHPIHLRFVHDRFSLPRVLRPLLHGGGPDEIPDEDVVFGGLGCYRLCKVSPKDPEVSKVP